MKRKLFNISIIILLIFIDFTNYSYKTSCSYNAIAVEATEKVEGVYIEINKFNNLLNIYLNGCVVYTFPVATGKEVFQTPEGTFYIITKVINPWYIPKNIPGGDNNNPLGTRWLGLSLDNKNGYNFGIHGTNDPSSIGKNVSQGCIRMLNKDVEWLYHHIPLNTIVIIK